MSQYLLVTGKSSEARRYAQNAADIGASVGVVGISASAHYYLGWAYHTAGDYWRAEDFLRKAIQESKGSTGRLVGLSVTSRWSLAISLAERGAFEEAIPQAEEGVQLGEAADDAYSRFLGYWGLGHVCSFKGDLSRAGAMLERALALSRGWNFPIQSAYIAAQLGYVYALSERVTEGLALVRQACADLESAGMVAFHSLVVAHLSEACRLANRLEDATVAAARVLSLARERGERGREAEALPSWARPPRPVCRSTPKQLTTTTLKPWHWPLNSACVPSWLTATSDWGGSPAGQATARRHATV
jgi:tetratricopeptide (TPR) repeat protein